MEPSYEWLSFGKSKSSPGKISFQVNNIIDIMGAPIQSKEEFCNCIERILKPNSTLCISGELKKYGEGKPASNYRHNDDEENENIISNYFYLFQLYKNISGGRPIFVTTIPRSWRRYSFYIRPNGTILQEDLDYRRLTDEGGRYALTGFPGGNEAAWDKEADDLMFMLYSKGIDSNKLIKLRKSCSSSKFNTYLIDMISFLYQMKIDSSEFHGCFHCQYRSPVAVTGGERVGNWEPKQNMNYLYFDNTHENDGFLFFSPNKESVRLIYHEFEQAINPYENDIKRKIRNHLCKYHIDRWTDFDVNDTDDAFTILMLIHAFTCRVSRDGNILQLAEQELSIQRELEDILKPWFSRLG